MRNKHWREVVFIITAFMCSILLLGINSAKGARLIGHGTLENMMTRERVCKRQIAPPLSQTVQSTQKRYNLGGTGSISGYVKDPEGNPLANIWVNLHQSDNPDWAGDEAWDWVTNAMTNSEGYYTLTSLTARRYHLSIYTQQAANENHYISADQYNVQVFDGAATPNINFTLRRAGLIWGYIKTTGGDPIPSAQVVAHSAYTQDGDSGQQTQEISADGKYELWVLPSQGKFYPIHVDSAIIPGITYKVYGGNNSINGQDGLHPLDHGYTLLGSGTATKTFNGTYAYYLIIAEPGYLVKIDALQGSNNSYYGISSSWDIQNWDIGESSDGKFASLNKNQGWEDEGGYLLVNPGTGNTSLKVYITGDTRTNADPKIYEAKMAQGLYQATLDGIRGPDFSLNEAGIIHGRVVNKDGVGIEGVEVDPQVGVIDDPDDKTDSNGYYTLISIPVTSHAYAWLDLYYPVEQNGIKYARGEQYVGPFTITPGATVEAPVMTLLVAGTLKGQVTDENGTPIVGAEINIEGFDIDGYPAWGNEEVYTDALGQYSSGYMAPGTYNVMASKDGSRSGIKSGIVITSGNLTDCDLVLKSKNQSATVSGKITNYNLAGPQDSSGTLLPLYGHFDYGIPNPMILAVSADIEYTEHDLLSLGEASFLGMTDPADGYGDYFQVSGTETAGSYTFILPPGNIDIGIGMYEDTEYGGYITFHGWKRMNLTAGAELSNQDLTAKTSLGTLQGEISVPGGSTLNFYKTGILAYNVDDVAPSAFPDAFSSPEYGKTYCFKRLPIGTYTIRAISEGFVTQVYENVVVSEGATTTRNIAFTSGGSLSGKVTVQGTADPVAGALVKVVETGQTVATNASGSYTMSGLAAGDYSVEITASGYAASTHTITIQQGQVTTGNFSLDSTVGSIKGKVTASGANVNGATVVAYNTTTNTFKTATTVGGAFHITELVPGNYTLAVNATGYNVTVYPAATTITLGEHQDYILPADIALLASPPKFTVNSSASADTPPILSMTFISDLPLDAVPTFTKIEGFGAGVLGSSTKVSDYEYHVTYTANGSDTLVKIKIEGASNGQSGNKTFSFEVNSDLTYTASTNVTNATGGEATMMGTQDNTKVYVPPFALAGTTDNTTAVALTVKRYGEPGDAVEGTDDKSVSSVYDFSFENDTVSIKENHTVTVTMGFKLPAGMSQHEFENTFKVRYFNVNAQKWQTDGISNTKINWNNNTITFDVGHLTQFAVFAPPAASQSGGGSGGGGCFIDALTSRKSPANHKSIMDILGGYLRYIFIN